MKVVLDTSILIDHLRGGDLWERLLDTLQRENAIIYIPTVVVFELFSGKSTKKISVVKEIDELIRDFRRIELTEDMAVLAGKLYRDVNKTFQVPDYIIAASALSIGASVLALNKKDFQQIPGLNIYGIGVK